MPQELHDLILVFVKWLEGFGYYGVSLGIGLESACIPIPSEVILPFTGYMVYTNKLDMFFANIAINLGSMIGSFVAYSIGCYGGRPFISKYGKYFFISEKHFDVADRWFNKYGSVAVFFGRLLPVIRTFISLPAGIAKMDIRKFSVYSLLGMIPWNFALIWIGYKLGDKWDTLSPYFKKIEYIILGIVALIITYLAFKYVSKKKYKKKSSV